MKNTAYPLVNEAPFFQKGAKKSIKSSVFGHYHHAIHRPRTKLDTCPVKMMTLRFRPRMIENHAQRCVESYRLSGSVQVNILCPYSPPGPTICSSVFLPFFCAPVFSSTRKPAYEHSCRAFSAPVQNMTQNDFSRFFPVFVHSPPDFGLSSLLRVILCASVCKKAIFGHRLPRTKRDTPRINMIITCMNSDAPRKKPTYTRISIDTTRKTATCPVLTPTDPVYILTDVRLFLC